MGGAGRGGKVGVLVGNCPLRHPGCNASRASLLTRESLPLLFLFPRLQAPTRAAPAGARHLRYGIASPSACAVCLPCFLPGMAPQACLAALSGGSQHAIWHRPPISPPPTPCREESWRGWRLMRLSPSWALQQVGGQCAGFECLVLGSVAADSNSCIQHCIHAMPRGCQTAARPLPDSRLLRCAAVLLDSLCRRRRRKQPQADIHG